MQADWATENLQVIRTLMERATVYRRALGPVMLMAGLVGMVAGALAWFLQIDTPRGFGCFWIGISAFVLGIAFVQIRRQAIKARETFWSPPTRRIVQGITPGFAVGLLVASIISLPSWRDPLQVWWLVPAWMCLYGCAMHAAAFFMPRGIRLFACIYLVLGAVLAGYINIKSHGAGLPALQHGHLLMGLVFGGLHFIYGVYLLFTERKNAA